MKSLKIEKKKEAGFVLTSELVLIVTILVIGMTVGLVTMRDALNAEMEDVAEAIGALDQTYSIDGIINGELTALIGGSVFTDLIDADAGDGEQFVFFRPGLEGDDVTPPPAPQEASSNTGSLSIP